jgi:hypothetical protein
MSRGVWRALALALCALFVTETGVAAEKSPAPAKKAAAEKAPAKSKAKSKAKAKPASKKAEDAPPHPSTLPWSIRGQYGIGYNDLSFVYSTDNAEWRIVRNETEVLVDNVGMTITLGDGSVVNVADFLRGSTDFKEMNDASGKYRQFWVQMAPRAGLDVRHWVDRYSDKPYLILRSEITNVSDKPVTIREVTPAVLEGKDLVLTPEAVAVKRPVVRRGDYVLYDPSATRYMLFNDPGKKFMLGVGSFFETGTPVSVSLEKKDTAWQGKITCDYSPGHVLKPGEKLKVEPVLFNFFMPKPTDVDIAYALALSTLPQPAAPAPPAWVTVAPTESAQALLATVDAWGGSDVKHALVPAPYSGAEGYPYDAKQLARELRSRKMTPGIAIDPLGVRGAAENLTVAGADGRRWINPALPEARDFAAQQLKTLVDYGYGFFVVAPSAIPDAALLAIGVSRNEADDLAFDIAASAAGSLPVVPAPAATLGNEVDAWLEADAPTSRLRTHNVAVGPVRVDVAKLGDPSDGLQMAIAMYPGPLELVGMPSGLAKKLFPQPVTFAQPLDVQQVPKLWHAQEKVVRSGPRSMVVAYPGAPAWTEADLAGAFEGKPKSMRVEADGSMHEAK